MKAAKVVLVVLAVCALIGWVRNGHSPEHIARTLPFCGGHRPGLYDLGALAVLGLLLWGLARLRNGRQTDRPEEEPPLVDTEEVADVAQDTPRDEEDDA